MATRTESPALDRGGLDASALKLIAICAMVVDHVAFAFVPDGTPLAILMHAVGRITGPVMFYMAAEGCRHTRSFRRYALRLLLFAAVSYLPFQFFCYGRDLLSRFRWSNLNVIYTILLGVLAIRARRSGLPAALRVLIILALACLSVPGDWGVTGFLLIVVFDFYSGSFRNQAFAYLLIVLLDSNAGALLHLLTSPVFDLVYRGALDLDLEYYAYSIQNIGMFLPLLLLWSYNGRRGGGKWDKWLFYFFYPAHLLVLGLLECLLL